MPYERHTTCRDGLCFSVRLNDRGPAIEFFVNLYHISSNTFRTTASTVFNLLTFTYLLPCSSVMTTRSVGVPRSLRDMLTMLRCRVQMCLEVSTFSALIAATLSAYTLSSAAVFSKTLSKLVLKRIPRRIAYSRCW